MTPKTAYEQRVNKRVLTLVNPKRKKAVQKPPRKAPLSAKEKKKLQLHKIPPSLQK